MAEQLATLAYANKYWTDKVKPLTSKADDNFPAFLLGFSAGLAYGKAVPSDVLARIVDEAVKQLHIGGTEE
jgi:hypothetical protein